MATSKATKAGIGIAVVALIALGFAGMANAQPDEDDDDDLPPPPPDDDDTIPVEPAGPLPQPPPVCNYVGCGPQYVWPRRDRFPNERSFGLALQQLGYVINPAAGDFSIVSTSSRNVVRQFQRDYNKAAGAQTVDANPAPSQLAADGLIGAQTINGLLNAQRWIVTLNVTWADLVALA